MIPSRMPRPLRILFVSSEVAPFSKTGGLGDVAGALPAALAALGHDVMVVTPRYATLKEKDGPYEDTGEWLWLRFPVGETGGPIFRKRLAPNHEVLFLGNILFDRDGIYGDSRGEFGDNALRFGYLSVGALSAAQLFGFAPDIVHLNDWPCGPAAVALERGYRGTSLERARTVFTIHNLAYQGVFPKRVMDELGLPWELFHPGGLEFHDAVNFMKAGLVYSDALTTVSPTYAREIQSREGGASLEGVLKGRRHALTGIVNGIDTDVWNPAIDPILPARFTADSMEGKARCKAALLERFGLPPTDAPVFSVVSRLAPQKGIDLLMATLPRVMHSGLRFVALGSGDPQLEGAFHQLQARYPGQVGTYVGFDEKLSHLIEAGSDFFLMPSRYEPCGLNQLYSLAYGTVPVVRSTGGLADTVTDFSQPHGTGVRFDAFDVGALEHAIWRSLQLYGDKALLDAVRRRGMAQDFSWGASARAYEGLYRRLVPYSHPL